MHACIHGCACEDQGLTAGVFLDCSSSYIPRQDLTLEPIRVHKYNWSSGLACPGEPAFVSWCWEAKLSPLCLQAKHFPYFPISPDPHMTSFLKKCGFLGIQFKSSCLCGRDFTKRASSSSLVSPCIRVRAAAVQNSVVATVHPEIQAQEDWLTAVTAEDTA